MIHFSPITYYTCVYPIINFSILNDQKKKKSVKLSDESNSETESEESDSEDSSTNSQESKETKYKTLNEEAKEKPKSNIDLLLDLDDGKI